LLNESALEENGKEGERKREREREREKEEKTRSSVRLSDTIVTLFYPLFVDELKKKKIRLVDKSCATATRHDVLHSCSSSLLTTPTDGRQNN
jgi:hypothetical protein